MRLPTPSPEPGMGLGWGLTVHPWALRGWDPQCTLGIERMDAEACVPGILLTVGQY